MITKILVMYFSIHKKFELETEIVDCTAFFGNKNFCVLSRVWH